MADKPANVSVRNRYASQFAADLADNLAEQAELQKRLDKLRSEEAWLRSVQDTLTTEGTGPSGTTRLSAEPATAAVREAPLPQPRQEESSSPAARVKKAAGRKTAARKTTATSGEPALGVVLLSVLESTTGEPRTAAEVTTDLEKTFPARARDVNTVRNTLERLVAKSLVERSKQGRSVYYSVPHQRSQGDVRATDATASAGDGGENVPAQV